jgi:hypothetical protein
VVVGRRQGSMEARRRCRRRLLRMAVVGMLSRFIPRRACRLARTPHHKAHPLLHIAHTLHHPMRPLQALRPSPHHTHTSLPTPQGMLPPTPPPLQCPTRLTRVGMNMDRDRERITQDREVRRRSLVGMRPQVGMGLPIHQAGTGPRRDLPLASMVGSLPRSFRVRIRIIINSSSMNTSSSPRRSLGVARRIRAGGKYFG